MLFHQMLVSKSGSLNVCLTTRWSVGESAFNNIYLQRHAIIFSLWHGKLTMTSPSLVPPTRLRSGSVIFGEQTSKCTTPNTLEFQTTRTSTLLQKWFSKDLMLCWYSKYHSEDYYQFPLGYKSVHLLVFCPVCKYYTLKTCSACVRMDVWCFRHE